MPLQQYKSKTKIHFRESPTHLISLDLHSNMDTRLKSVTLLTLILLASLFTSLLSVSEARPLRSPMPGKYGIIREVNGVFRSLKSSGPSPGVGHRLNKLQNLGHIIDSGPSPGVGHRLNKLQNLGEKKNPGSSPGVVHRLNKSQNLGQMKDSGPSPGGGH